MSTSTVLADRLNFAPMKWDRIRAVRDKIMSLSDAKFTMADTCTKLGVLAYDLEHDCDTAGCIAGWVCALFAPDRLPSCWLAARLLGLTTDEGRRLFNPEHKALSAITRKETLSTLDNLIATKGEIVWA